MRYTRQKLQLEHNKGEVSEKVTPSGPTLCTWVTSEGGEMPEMSFFFLVTDLCWFSVIFWFLLILRSDRVT